MRQLDISPGDPPTREMLEVGAAVWLFELVNRPDVVFAKSKSRMNTDLILSFSFSYVVGLVIDLSSKILFCDRELESGWV